MSGCELSATKPADLIVQQLNPSELISNTEGAGKYNIFAAFWYSFNCSSVSNNLCDSTRASAVHPLDG